MTKEPALRIPPLPREEWTDEARDVFQYWEGPAARENGSRSNSMMVMANHPELAMANLDMGKYMMLKSLLSMRQRELLVLRIAWRFNNTYQLAHHIHAARQMGFTEAELEALQHQADPKDWNSAEFALLSAVDQLCDGGQIDDETFQLLSETMNRREIMDLIYMTGFFAMNVWAVSAMGVQLEPDLESFSKQPTK